MSQSNSNYEDFSEIYELVIASLSGEITPDQVARLDKLVCNDPRACELYLQLIRESTSLRTWASATREETVNDIPSRSRSNRSQTLWWRSIVAVASLIVCFLLGRNFFGSADQSSNMSSNQQLILETKAVMAEARSVLDLLDQLEQENDTIVMLIGEDADVDANNSSAGKEAS